ncbi:MAG: translation initiation factor IF-2 N-terminal domain-containing protein, partial [Anaeromyxobacteraceae bacterium]
MSKKRVHELAKQLKEAGIELSNQELVEKLHALGYDVKSHSSSLEEDQSQSAYERIVAEKKPKAPTIRPTGPGFVVRKRAHVEPAPVAAPEPPAPVEETAEEFAEDEEQQIEAAEDEGAPPVEAA